MIQDWKDNRRISQGSQSGDLSQCSGNWPTRILESLAESKVSESNLAATSLQHPVATVQRSAEAGNSFLQLHMFWFMIKAFWQIFILHLIFLGFCLLENVARKETKRQAAPYLACLKDSLESGLVPTQCQIFLVTFLVLVCPGVIANVAGYCSAPMLAAEYGKYKSCCRSRTTL